VSETLGETLREAREENGASIEDAAAATRIMQTQLRAIENNDYSGIPAPMYAKGFLKLYAQFLGLEPEPILERFQKEYSDPNRLRPSLSTNTQNKKRTPEAPPQPEPEPQAGPEPPPEPETVPEDTDLLPEEAESTLEGPQVDSADLLPSDPDPDEGLDAPGPVQAASPGSGISTSAQPPLDYARYLRLALPALFVIILVFVGLQFLRDRASRTPETIAFTGLDIPEDARIVDPPEPYLDPASGE
jgi:transcriptional regulator with XRE-family HTH domain